MILPKVVKPLQPDQQDTFVNRIDSDVVTALAEVLYEIVELDAEAFVNATHFDQTIDLLCEALGAVSEAELQRSVVRLLLIVTQSVQARLRAAGHLQQKVLAKYDKILRAIMASLALFRDGESKGRSGRIHKIADCFVTILSQADALGQLDSLRRSLYESFNDCEGLKQIS